MTCNGCGNNTCGGGCKRKEKPILNIILTDARPTTCAQPVCPGRVAPTSFTPNIYRGRCDDCDTDKYDPIYNPDFSEECCDNPLNREIVSYQRDNSFLYKNPSPDGTPVCGVCNQDNCSGECTTVDGQSSGQPCGQPGCGGCGQPGCGGCGQPCGQPGCGGCGQSCGQSSGQSCGQSCGQSSCKGCKRPWDTCVCENTHVPPSLPIPYNKCDCGDCAACNDCDQEETKCVTKPYAPVVAPYKPRAPCNGCQQSTCSECNSQSYGQSYGQGSMVIAPRVNGKIQNQPSAAPAQPSRVRTSGRKKSIIIEAVSKDGHPTKNRIIGTDYCLAVRGKDGNLYKGARIKLIRGVECEITFKKSEAPFTIYFTFDPLGGPSGTWSTDENWKPDPVPGLPIINNGQTVKFLVSDYLPRAFYYQTKEITGMGGLVFIADK